MRLPYRRALPADHQRVRRRAGRPARGPERGDPARRAGAAPERPAAGDPGGARPVIRDLVGDADSVIGQLADNRRNVGRFVVEARDTAAASAERQDDIRHELPQAAALPRELRPTMAALGEVADEQRPVLVDLSASARNLRRFFDDTAEFVEGVAAVDPRARRGRGGGREAVRAARPRVRELRDYARRRPTWAGTCGSRSRTSTTRRGRSSAIRAAPAAAATRASRRSSGTSSASRSRTTASTSWATWCAPPCTRDECGPYADAASARRSRTPRVPRVARARPAGRDRAGPRGARPTTAARAGAAGARGRRGQAAAGARAGRKPPDRAPGPAAVRRTPSAPPSARPLLRDLARHGRPPAGPGRNRQPLLDYLLGAMSRRPTHRSSPARS